MTPEHWREIERLYNAARDRGAAELEGADAELRREVEKLLEQESGGNILDGPAADGLTESTVTMAMPVEGMDPFETGTLVSGRFRITNKIAEGGMGVVYLAIDEKLDQPRALKVAKLGYGRHLPPEARSALSVTHPNVCRVFEIHTAETPLGPVDFLSMEFIDGGSLSRRLAEHGAFAGAEALALAAQICAGLNACHAQNLLHRDLKPNNVLLTHDANGELRAAVTDFGIAVEAPLLSADGHGAGGSPVSGTPAYLAPELWQGKPASVASDIFALGLVLHEIVTGHRPQGVREEPRVVDPNIPGRWRKVIARCVDTDPAQRFRSATEVAEALTGQRSRRRVIWVSAAAVVFAAAGAWRLSDPVTPPSRLAVLAVEAPGADSATASLVRGASFDLSSRLVRLRPRPPQLVVIPVEQTQGVSPAQAAVAKERLGASHILRATVTPAGTGLLLRAAIVDTTSQVVFRETSAELASASEISPRLAALVAAAFNLPRQTATETVAAAAYPDYAHGLALLRARTDYAQAIAAFENAIALDPNSPLPRAGIAEAYALAWDRTSDPHWLARGREEVAHATAVSPDSLSVHLAAGTLDLSGGSNEHAAQEFQRAIQLDGSSVEAWNGLAQAYQALEGRRAEAAAAYLKAIQLQPGYPVPLQYFAEFQRRMGNYQEAEDLLKRAVQLVPQSAVLHNNLGGLYVDRGRSEEAEHELMRALELDPGFRLAMNNLGALYQYLGRDADAVEIFERARSAGPESYILDLNLGDSYHRLGDQPSATAAYRRANKLAEARLLANPSDAATRAFVAYFSLRLGDRATAEREIAQALHFGAKDRTVIRRAVIYFEASGQRVKALDVLQSATPDLLAELNRQPDLTSLRKDPQFVALLPSN
jgi:Flp pilus assembly protein TadD